MDNRLATLPPSTSSPASSADRELLNGVIDVVQSLTVMFPQLGASGVDRKAMLREWALGLSDMRPHEIARGMSACRSRTFAPGVGEFAQMCRPTLDPEVAWHEAQMGLQARDRGEQGEWSHPAVWRAAMAMPWEVRTSQYRASRARWTRVLQDEFSNGWGEPVPPVAEKIEHRPTLRPMPDEIRRQLASLGYRDKGKKK